MNLTARKEAKEQGLKRYFTGEPCINGHYSERTVSCGKCLICHKNRESARRENAKKSHEELLSESLKKEWLTLFHSPVNTKKRKAANRLYRIFTNPKKHYEAARKSSTKYKENNRDKVLERKRELYQLNIESKRAYARQWQQKDENKEKAALRVSAYRIKNPCHTFIRTCMQRIGKGYNVSKYENIIGYSQKDFISHIESQFVDGMTWDNRSEWHIDHIKPISLFIKEGETNPAIINALSNLQPLWAKDNLLKGASY
jgi:hypothetical protein